jgi:hypothetical protein
VAVFNDGLKTNLGPAEEETLAKKNGDQKLKALRKMEMAKTKRKTPTITHTCMDLYTNLHYK